MASGVPVMISVHDPGDTARVAGALREKGVQVDEVLEELGTITATHPGEKLAELASIAGVKHVERRGGVKLPPPDSGVQ
jgi:hypothetical protein